MDKLSWAEEGDRGLGIEDECVFLYLLNCIIRNRALHVCGRPEGGKLFHLSS